MISISSRAEKFKGIIKKKKKIAMMNYYKRVITLITFTLTLTPFIAKAQQLPVYSQYMMNGFLLNPAVAGHEGYTALNITAREQWAGLFGLYWTLHFPTTT